MPWIVPPGNPHLLGSDAGRCADAHAESVQRAGGQLWRLCQAAGPVPDAQGVCLVPVRGYGQTVPMVILIADYLIGEDRSTGVSLRPPTRPSARPRTVYQALYGRARDQLISRTASNQLVRHPPGR